MSILTSKLRSRAASSKRIVYDWAATHVFKGSRAVTTPFGFKLVASRYLGNNWMAEGKFEVEEVRIAQRVLKDVDVFVDVGANIGYYTCLAGAFKVPVLAFEPYPRNLRDLYQSIRLNEQQNVEVFPLALGSEPSIVEIFGATGPSASLLQNWAGYSSKHRHTISVNTMDALVGHRVPGKRAFVKIDVEGFEYQVLLGAKQLINADPKPIWLIEVCLGDYHPGGNKHYADTFNLFFDAGYRVFTADAEEREVSRQEVAQWQAAGKCPMRTFNYLIQA